MNPTIPTKFYTSQEVLDFEKREIFNSGLKYRGHQLMVETHKYVPLINTMNRWNLVNNEGEYNLLSNVCLHRQSQLVEESGNKNLISCRVHCWSYDLKGNLKIAPHFKEKPESKLERRPLNSWNGLLFEGSIPDLNLADCGIEDYVNFEEYFYHKTESTEYNFNWKVFSEIYLENYHVYSMHPGLRNFVKPSDLEWIFGKDYSVQKVGIGSNLNNHGSKVYGEWHSLIKTEHTQLPRYGAIWMYIYPNIMIEWYPNVIVISTVYPDSKEPNKCINYVEYYYKKELYQRNPQYYEAFESVYSETAKEDEEACMLIERGRTSLYLNGESQEGPCEPFLEAGVSEFFSYLDEKYQNFC